MAHPDPKQLPSKGKPWSALLSQDFIHKIDLILPQESADRLRMKLAHGIYAPTYHRVIMKLGDILDGEFFTQYVKIGNIMMLSEGRMGQDNVFLLNDGKLSMFLEKETYERAGLQGQPHGVRGKRGLKPRWIVEFDLQAPSSFPGKKGYDRLLYACKNVFNQPVTWLFHRQSGTPDPDPLARHFPVQYTSVPAIFEDIKADCPSLEMPEKAAVGNSRQDLEDFATDIYEWLSLLRLDSPRVHPGDSVDPFLSRYAIPGAPEDLSQVSLCKVSWQGFIAPAWARQTLADIMLSISSRSWFSMSATSLSKGVTGDNTECTIFRPSNAQGEYFLWDIRGHE